MKKILLTVVLLVISSFMFIPENISALTTNNYIYFGVNTPPINDIGDVSDYNQDNLTCTGEDSILGNPDDENSVAWLLDKILTYTTLVGMILVVVLSSIDFLKVIVNSSDDDMGKAGKKLALRLIFAILLFFVPTLTNAILDLFGLTSDSTCGIQQ